MMKKKSRYFNILSSSRNILLLFQELSFPISKLQAEKVVNCITYMCRQKKRNLKEYFKLIIFLNPPSECYEQESFFVCYPTLYTQKKNIPTPLIIDWTLYFQSILQPYPFLSVFTTPINEKTQKVFSNPCYALDFSVLLLSQIFTVSCITLSDRMAEYKTRKRTNNLTTTIKIIQINKIKFDMATGQYKLQEGAIFCYSSNDNV